MAREFEEYTSRGAEIVGVSVDPSSAGAALIEKLALPFPLLSDPDGEGLIKPLEAWNPSEDKARPSILAVAPDGEVVYRSIGQDYMDRRPDDSEVVEALDSLGLEPHHPPPPRPAEGRPTERGAPVTRDFLFPYYRGIHFATKALLGRMEDEAARHQLDRTHRQATRYMEAISATRKLLS